MMIDLPQNKLDIYSFLNKQLYREVETIDSPAVYGLIDDRLSKLIQTEGRAGSLIEALPITDYIYK